MGTLRYRLLGLLAACLLAAALPCSGQTLQIDSIKANYIEGFMDFLRWDGEVNASEAIIGVVGSKELANHLERIAARKSGGRALKIVRLSPGDTFERLHVVFVGAGNRTHWPELCDQGKAARALLIGEEDGFIRSGGGIEFVVRKNRLRFIIDVRNAQACGIDVSSKLVELATE